MKLYRAISAGERDDYYAHQELRTGINTLEAKQFFRSDTGVREFVHDSRRQHYQPPYLYLLIVDIDDDCLNRINYDEQELDRFEAITVFEQDLPAFNNCVNFIEENAI